MAEPAYGWDDDRQATLRALVKRADRGDQAALPAIKQVFDAVSGVWDSYGDLATIAHNSMVDLLAGKSALTREALQRKIGSMRAELAGPKASPLERLAVDRALACYLQGYQADVAYTRSPEETVK